MKINSKSWYIWLYRSTYGVWGLPDNLCPFFWGLLFSIIAIPVTWTIHVIKLFTERGEPEQHNALGFGTVITFISFLIGCAYIPVNERGYYSHWILIYFKGLGSFFAIAAGLFIVFLIFYYLSELIKSIKSKRPVKEYNHEDIKPKRTNLLFAFIKAKLGKYCPKIEWI